MSADLYSTAPESSAWKRAAGCVERAARPEEMTANVRDQLIETRDQEHSKDHSFFDLWAEGKLTKEQTALYCIQHFHYVAE